METAVIRGRTTGEFVVSALDVAHVLVEPEDQFIFVDGPACQIAEDGDGFRLVCFKWGAVNLQEYRSGGQGHTLVPVDERMIFGDAKCVTCRQPTQRWFGIFVAEEGVRSSERRLQ